VRSSTILSFAEISRDLPDITAYSYSYSYSYSYGRIALLNIFRCPDDDAAAAGATHSGAVDPSGSSGTMLQLSYLSI
jgi:hypothetical protein